MERTIVRHTLALASFVALALGGCAQQGEVGPSYLGLADLTSEAAPAPAEQPSEALRYVQSNKVLGAMAFHSVTGRTVDPESLSGRE
ncbi:MAG TPA: hypothetical protein VIF13_07765 [Hyphomicrobium sp.]|jgi:hypothetical protein